MNARIYILSKTNLAALTVIGVIAGWIGCRLADAGFVDTILGMTCVTAGVVAMSHRTWLPSMTGAEFGALVVKNAKEIQGASEQKE
jgi:hypothetical protein